MVEVLNMKKHLLIISVVLLVISTICYLLKYTNVADYSTAMQKVREKNSTYTIEAIKKTRYFQKREEESYVKVSIKGKKWLAEYSEDGGKTFEGTKELYDGNHYYTIMNNTTATIDKFNSNPVFSIYNWHLIDQFINAPNTLNCKMWHFAGIGIENGHICRKIKYSNSFSACVSDKYGIAMRSEKNSKIATSKIKVKKITAGEYLSDANFRLPPGTRVGTFEEYTKSVQDKLKQLEQLIELHKSK